MVPPTVGTLTDEGASGMHRQISPHREKWSAPHRSAVGQAMAVLGSASTVGLVAELLATDEAAVRAAVRGIAAGARSSTVVDELDPGARILRDTPAQVRQNLHRRAAELLHDKGFPAAAVAAHLVAANCADHPWAARVLLSAAAEDMANDQIDRAVQRLELAYRATGDPGERATIAIRLLRAEWRLNPSDRTRGYARMRSAVRAGRVPAAQLPAAVLFLLWHGQTQYADQALTQLNSGGLDETAPRIGFLCAWLRYTHPPLAQRHPWLLAAHPSRRGETTPHALGSRLLIGLFGGRPADETGTRAQCLLTRHRLAADTVETLAAAVHCLIYTDRLDTAAAWCDSLLAEAAARKAPTWQSIFAGLRAETMLRKGDARAAADDAMLALNCVPAEHLGIWIGTPIAALVRALTLAGRHTEAAAQLRRPVPRALFESRFGLAYLHAEGHHQLAVARSGEALRTFRRCGHLMRRWHMDFPWLVPWRNDLAAAHLALGEHCHARAVATRHLDLLGSASDHRTGGVSLRLLAATADRYRRIRLLRGAASIARSGGCDFELATVLGELGVAHRAVGDHDKSRALLREATRLADSCGADTLLHDLLGERPRRAAPALARLRAHAHRLDALSPAERRVAALAARGKRNRDIAAALDITTSTVEQHLTRVYRKLEISRRTELAFAMGET
ncbi:regulatory LuxR family protein [Nocardia tenerifensis]|uniref:Regulatory LuxR family protein n=3 Tax=Nocardia tenerifensis TaxID=228006 RepID=A0A318KCT6_9NOCA|nr:helix-turn-helix transcriptional regulator [Nocardia tenerifensis]PXX56367.1 regulatory LuxR family protein [Nocardia tenerifensis]